MTGPSRRAALRRALTAVALLTAPPAAAGCADGFHVVVESGTVRRAAPAGTRFTEEQVEALRARMGERVKGVMNAMCRARTLPRARLKGVRQLVVEQDSACATLCVRSEAKRFGGGALLLHYAYGETGLTLPEPPAIETALRAWAAAGGR